MAELLTHWGRVTHIYAIKLIIIGSCNGLSPERRQAIIWTNAWILLIGTLGTNFSQILSEIHTFSFKKMHLKMSSVKWRPFCFGLNGLMQSWINRRVVILLEIVSMKTAIIITVGKASTDAIRVHFVHAPSQWETTLHCNVVSHWLGTYTEWSCAITCKMLQSCDLLLDCGNNHKT